MPVRKKINLEKVKASLATPCPQCGYRIPPARVGYYQSHVAWSSKNENSIGRRVDVRAVPWRNNGPSTACHPHLFIKIATKHEQVSA
jgi:hypothetical protein